jgi:hypothetical protein
LAPPGGDPGHRRKKHQGGHTTCQLPSQALPYMHRGRVLRGVLGARGGGGVAPAVGCWVGAASVLLGSLSQPCQTEPCHLRHSQPQCMGGGYFRSTCPLPHPTDTRTPACCRRSCCMTCPLIEHRKHFGAVPPTSPPIPSPTKRLIPPLPLNPLLPLTKARATATAFTPYVSFVASLPSRVEIVGVVESAVGDKDPHSTHHLQGLWAHDRLARGRLVTHAHFTLVMHTCNAHL